MSTLRRTGLAAAVAAALTFTTTPAAHAEVDKVHDGPDTSASNNDILRMRAEHGDKRIKVRFVFADLHKKADNPASINIWFDKDKDHRGPEFGLAAPLANGTDYLLTPTDNWRSHGEPVPCTYVLEFKWAKETIAGWLADDCFGKPDKIRVGARMADPYDSSHPVVDWVEGPRNWTPWLSAG